MNIPDNMVIEYYVTGSIYRVYEMDEYDNIHGIYVSWNPQGVIRNCNNWVHGELDGKYNTWHTNGQLKECSAWEKGFRNGKYVTWYENGNINEESYYLHGERHGLYVYSSVNTHIKHIMYFYHGKDITSELKSAVSDICNITENEKTLLALKHGIIL